MFLVHRVLCLFTLIAGAGMVPASLSATLECGKGKAFSSVTEAVSRAKPGDKILVWPGVYREHMIHLNKSLEIIGKGMPVIDGGFDNDVFIVQGSNIIINGLEITNSGRSSSRDYAGIKMINAEHCVIENCRFINDFFGMHLDHSRHCIIRNNILDGHAVSETASGNGIHIWKCDSFSILFNTIRNHRDGIYFEFVKYSRIISNISNNNVRYGLHFMFSDFDAYHFNTFCNNGAGVAVMYTQHIDMKGNTFKENWGPASYGLLLKDINFSTIRNNFFIGNTVGIQMENANKLSIRGNNFNRNGWAMRLMGNCEYDTVVGNNFFGNSFDLATNSSGTGNLNILEANYWDKYKGYDLNRDAYGDVPYRPVSLFSMFVESVPPAVVLLHSFMIDVLDEVEKNLPSLIPVTLLDAKPRMKRLVNM